jgi:RNA polymerase sigma factor (TIGR02999 family)
MSDVTQILSKIELGDKSASAQLLPLIYDELRKLAQSKMASESPGQTLQPTALVHEAYIRLVDVGQAQHWESRGHFFVAAGEAMRRILVEQARKKGRRERIRESMTPLAEMDRPSSFSQLELLALDEAISKLESSNRQAAEIVKLRFFSGMTVEQAAKALGISIRSAHRQWTFARAYLHRELEESAI